MSRHLAWDWLGIASWFAFFLRFMIFSWSFHVAILWQSCYKYDTIMWISCDIFISISFHIQIMFIAFSVHFIYLKSSYFILSSTQDFIKMSLYICYTSWSIHIAFIKTMVSDFILTFNDFPLVFPELNRWDIIEGRLVQWLSSVSHIRHFVGGLAGRNRPVSGCVVSQFESNWDPYRVSGLDLIWIWIWFVFDCFWKVFVLLWSAFDCFFQSFLFSIILNLF